MSYPIQLRQHKLWYINFSDFLHLQKDDEQKRKKLLIMGKKRKIRDILKSSKSPLHFHNFICT